MGIFIMLTMQTITIFRACFQLAMGITEAKKHYIFKNVLLYLFFFWRGEKLIILFYTRNMTLQGFW